MAAIDRLVGRDLVIIWTPTSGTATTISADFTTFSTSRTMDTADVTAGNERARYHKGTIEDMTWEMKILYSDQAYLDDVKPDTTGSIEVRPEGTGAGKPMIKFNAIITDTNYSYPFDDRIEIDISGKRIGTMTNDVGSTQ